jgi:hypothetical protein
VSALILLPPQLYLAGDQITPASQAALPRQVTIEISLTLVSPANAQSCEGTCESNYPPLSGVASPGPSVSTGISGTTSTAAYVDELKASVAFCQAITNREFLVDCLSERIGATAQRMPAYGDVSAMRATLLTASRKLGAVAAKYRAPATPAVRLQSTGANPITTTRPLRPVASENLDAALAEAATIVAETETVLLRSAEGSQDRALDFQQVAAVMGSTKVLLRSS